SHPNIVAVHDFGMAGRRYLYIVMEFIDGSDLLHVMKAGQMTPELALYLVPQICDALAYAHEHGIVHRDIKPANIMLTKDWRVKVADFGLAKRFEADSTLMTRSNVGMGTADFAAPEQFKEPASVDHRADIYALGVTFYQMLTGELPRGAWQPPSVLVRTDPRLDPIVSKAMMPKREERYQSARELQQSVIGFTQLLAWEYQNKSALDAARHLQTAQPAPAAQPKAANAPVPKPRKPEGRLAAPRGKTADKPAEAAPAEKSRKPLLLGLGAAAVIAIGALALLSSGSRETSPESATTPEQTLTSSAAQSSPAAGSGAGTNGGDSQPQAARQGERSEATRETSPPPAMTAAQSIAALPADLQARLDAVPWTPFDPALKFKPDGTLKDGVRAPPGKNATFQGGRLTLTGGHHVVLADQKMTDCAVRIRVVANPQEKHLKINLRNGIGNRVNAGREDDSEMGRLGYVENNSGATTVGIPDFLMPPPGIAYTLEAFALGNTWGVRLDGRLVAVAESDKAAEPGTPTLYAVNALIESIEYKILDGVAAPTVATGRSAGPPAAAPLEWKKLDLSGKLEPAYSLSSMPADAGAEFRDNLLNLHDMFYLLIANDARDVAVRIRLAADQSEKNVRINLRSVTPGKRLSAGRHNSSLGKLDIHDSGPRISSSLAPDYPLPTPGTAWTLETFAIEDALGTLVDGRLAAYAEASELPHSGKATLNAQHALIESIEYLVLDGVPREQWPAHLREAIDTKGKPAPALAQSEISNQESQISLDAPGWTRLDLAKVQEEPGKVERLPDGAIQIFSGGVVRTDVAYPGDAAIRARIRGNAEMRNVRVVVRDEDNKAYSAFVYQNGDGFLIPFVRGGKTMGKDFKIQFPNPKVDTTKTFTLELRAQGSTLTVLVDGKQVAQAQDDQLKFGRLGVFADRGIVEGIAYQAGGSGNPAAADEGWQRVELASAKVNNPAKAALLQDGTMKLTEGFVWSPSSHQDVQVRVRFKPGPNMKNPSVLVRDTDGIAYSLSPYGMSTYVWGGEALRRGDKETKTKKFATLAMSSKDVQTMELHVQGDQLTGFINGQKVAEATDDMLKDGAVGVFANEGIVESFEIKPILKDRATVKPGDLVWKTNLGGNVIGPASQGADGMVYVMTDSSELAALRPADGSILWKCPLAGKPREGCTPVVADDSSVLAVVHGEGAHAGKGVLHCVDGATGKPRWQFEFEEGGTFPEASPAVSADGRVFISHRAADCLELASGRQIWTTPFPSQVAKAAPVIAMNGTVVCAAGGKVLALNPATGAILWQANLPSTCYGDPAVKGDAVFIPANAGVQTDGGNGGLLAYDVRDGRLLWRQVLGDKCSASLALDGNGKVIASSADQDAAVVACDTASGTVIWKAHNGTSRPAGYTVGADGLVYVYLDHEILCLNAGTGAVVWRYQTDESKSRTPLLLEDGLLITGSRDRSILAIQTSSRGLADSPWPTMGQNNRRNGRAKDAQAVVLQDTPVDKKLREIEARVRAEYDAGPGKVFADAAATLRAQYTNALKARAAQSQREGHLDHMLAFNQEAEAFTAGTLTAPPVDAPSTPEPLKQLRETFRKTLATHEAARDRAAAPIYAKWDAALDLLQKDLTKAGDINEALRVKKLRDQIVATKALTVATIGNRGDAPAATPATVPANPAGPQSRPTAPAPKLAKADDRKIAEWALSIPGSKVQHFNSSGTWASEITSTAKLPQGEFKLAKVQLADGSKAMEADLLQVAALERLEALSIESNAFNCATPALIAALARAPGFRELKIKGSNLEDADFAPLAAKKMTRFMVDECPRFTGAALAYFTDDPLRELNLKNSPVTEQTFEHVLQMKNLERVELNGLKLSPETLARLPSAKLTYLELSQMKHLSGKLDFLSRFEKVESVTFGYWTALTDEDVQALAQMKSLTELRHSGVKDATVAKLTQIPRLTRLAPAPYNDTGKNLGVLAALKNLRALELYSTSSPLNDEGLAAVATIPQLEELNLSDLSQITDAGMAEVAKLGKLTKLDLDRTKITDAGLEPLKALKKLETLDLTGTKATPAGIAALQKALPKCKIHGP
ncbi:MAG TPA: hypothetical protein DIT64_04135, partial [Verrucomicrobiales bacterium]|nr:hypothetical protein [Verrucomicrobiales bacterium]